MSPKRVRAVRRYDEQNEQADGELCVPDPEKRVSRMTSQNAHADGAQNDGVPVDRGWAWVIVCGSFINSALLYGYSKSTGVFFVELLDYFKSSNSHTALLFAIKGALYSIGGLFVMNVVVGRLGCRKTILIGAACLSLSAILASTANQLTLLIFMHGVMLGLADVMVISPAEVLVAAYFQKRRNLALAICKCGASVGAMIVPQLVTSLLSQWGLKGAFLMTGALLLHAFPAALLLRPTSYFRLSKRQSHQTPQDPPAVDEGKTLLGRRRGSSIDEGESSLRRPFPGYLDAAAETKSRLSPLAAVWTRTASEAKLSRSMEDIAAMLEASLNSDVAQDGITANTDHSGIKGESDDGGQVCLENGSERVENESKSEGKGLEMDLESVKQAGGYVTEGQGRRDNSGALDTGLDTGALDRLVASKHSRESSARVPRNKTFPLSGPANNDWRRLSTQNNGIHTAESEKDSLSETRRQPESASCARTVVSRLKACVFVLDWSLFRRPQFRIMFLCFALFPNAWMALDYLPALARERRVAETDVALLLTIVGALDLVSRLTSGLIADRQVVKVHVLIAASFALLGSVHQCVRLMTSVPSLLALAVVQGLLGSVVNCLIPILIVDTVGVKDMAKGIGFFQLAAGTFQAAVHPLLGHLRDVTGSYVIVYHVIGGCLLLAAVLLCIMGHVTHPESRSAKEAKQTADVSSV